MKEEIDGYRRTATKSRDKSKIDQKVEEFRARGEDVVVHTVAGIHYIYMRKEKPLHDSDLGEHWGEL